MKKVKVLITTILLMGNPLLADWEEVDEKEIIKYFSDKSTSPVNFTVEVDGGLAYPRLILTGNFDSQEHNLRPEQVATDFLQPIMGKFGYTESE